MNITELVIPTSGDEWTNKIYRHPIYGPLHCTRIIMSWVRKKEGALNNKRGLDLFYSWLTEELQFPEEVADEIYFIATNGKLELEDSAMNFIKKHKEEIA